MAFIEKMLAGGPGYSVTPSQGGASFKPVSSCDADIDVFQGVVTLLEDNVGDGYMIHLTHPLSDRPGNLVDLVVIALAGEDD